MSSSPEPVRLSVSLDSILESSSIESSPTTSPHDSLRRRSASVGMGSNPSVKFAPLPQLGPRKRRSKVPLGVSGRAELMRRRRATYSEVGEPANYDPPTWDGSRAQVDDPDDFDVVMLAMSKFIKDTSRQLWRRVSKDGGKKSSDEKEGKSPSEDDVLNFGKVDGEEHENEIREVVFIEGEEGVQVQFPQGISQTETVGRGYAWRTVSVVAPPTEAIAATTATSGEGDDG